MSCPHALTQEEFISRSRKKFKGRFIYTGVIYKPHPQKFTIVCKLHGEIQIVGALHLKSLWGCRKCARKFRKPAGDIINYPILTPLDIAWTKLLSQRWA